MTLTVGLFLIMSNPGRAQIWSRIMAEKGLTAQEVPAEKVPEHGTFWSFQRTNFPPLPFNQFPELKLPVYYLGYGNSFLVDDSSVDYVALAEQRETEKALRKAELKYGLREADELDALEEAEGGGMMLMAYEHPTNNALWLEITSVTNRLANLVVHGTVADQTYEILSKETLTNTIWASEGTILGAAGQDWTPTMVPVGQRTNSLFLWARSWQDSDGDGLPDWWELAHGLDPNNPDTGNTGVSDGYKDSDNDGWNNLQEYANGTNPNSFNSPPAPRGWAYISASGNSRVIEWEAAQGQVQGYELVKYYVYPSFGFWDAVSTQSVSAVTHTVTDTDLRLPEDDPEFNYYGYEEHYFLSAQYSGGASLPAAIQDQTTTLNLRLLHGPGDKMQLALLAFPKGTSAIRVSLSTNDGCGWGLGANQAIDMPIASFTNNLRAFTEQEYPLYAAYTITAQAIRSNGFAGLPRVIEPDCGKTIRYPFLDGRQVLKDNLTFALQAQSMVPPNTQPVYLGQTVGIGLGDRSGYSTPIPVFAAASYRMGESYWGFQGPVWNAKVDALLPWAINVDLAGLQHPSGGTPCFWSTNWFADADPSGYGGFCNGLFCVYWFGVNYYFNTTDFAHNQNTNPCPSALAAPAGRLIYNGSPTSAVIINGSSAHVATTRSNAYGLPLEGIYARYINYSVGSNVYNYFAAGASCPTNINLWYEQYAAPSLQSEMHQFTTGGDLAALSPHTVGTNNGLALTNVLITSVGNPDFTVSAWRRYHLLNGYSGIYGYAEQYFDKAFKMGTNGVVTTNQTGILSPYGAFFPTEPGPTALVTTPDLDTNQRGTAVVHVVKLQLDVNHDGVMDLSFAGPDNTSYDRPFKFWLNNDFDRFHQFYEPDWNNVYDEEEDDLKTGGSPGTVGITPDYNYQWADGAFAIPSKRDLEDYTRLWIPGMKRLYETHTNLSFELSIRNNDMADGPAINLVLAAESDGGTRYLTNTTTANDQISLPSGKCIGRIGPNSTIRLNDFFNLALYPGTGAEHFIWCGAKRGKGELVLQIKEGANLVAETSAWLDIKDIKEMYERWSIGDIGSKPPTNTAYIAVEEMPVGASKFQYGPPETTNTPYILHVHGWNMSRYEKDRYAETAFKRLYWQGYQGRFGEFRWPTKTGFTTFDTSEFQAWKSGVGLYRLLTNLNGTYPGRVYLTAHSMGNIVTAEALRMAGANQLVNTYIAMQAAIASHAYDPITTNRSMGIFDSYTPDRHAEYWTNGALSYLSGIQGAARIANFFNRRDWALAFWETDQNTKPDAGYSWVSVPYENERYYYQSGPNNIRQLYFPQDSYEIFSFTTEARCYAVGAQTNVAGAFTLSAQVNLDIAPYNFGDLHKGHSGEFRSTNMERWPFWEQVLFTMGLKASQ